MTYFRYPTRMVFSAAIFALNLPFAQSPQASNTDNSAHKKLRTQKPNILFIALDDLKPDLGCYGNTYVKSPNIDRIAQKGTVFSNNHCQQAICGPTRASLMTGKRPDYTKVWDLKTRMRDINPDILSLPQHLIKQGYTTAGIGKIYDGRCVGTGEDEPSWSIPYYKVNDDQYYNSQKPALGHYQNKETRKLAEQVLAESAKKGMPGNEARSFAITTVGPSVECIDLPDNAYMDGALVNKAKTILSDLAKGGNPFFFAVGFAKPHLPFVAPKKYWDLYDRNTVPLAQFTEHAAESPEFAYHNSGELRAYSDIPGIPGIPGIKSYTTNHIGLPVDKQRELVHGYYAAVSYADAQIGKLLDELERLGLAENTIVVLWGDHGWHLGDHDLWCKHSNFEQATRSPLIISAPWIRKSKTSSPTEFVDIFPTICDLAGVDVPKKLDGESLVPLMKKPGSKVKEFAVSQYPRKSLMGYSIRTDQYRLTYWMKDIYRSSMPFDTSIIVGKELYDYKTDPLETRSEVNNKKYKKVQQELDAQIVKFLKSQQVIN